MERSSTQKINKKTLDLNYSLGQMDLTDINRTFHPKATEYTLFSSTHGTFSRTEHTLVTKQVLPNFKKTEIILSICTTIV